MLTIVLGQCVQHVSVHKTLTDKCMGHAQLLSRVRLCNPMDNSLPGSSVHGISQARILEWLAVSFSRETSRLRNWTRVTCLAGRFFITEPPGNPHACIQQAKFDTKKRLSWTSEHLCFEGKGNAATYTYTIVPAGVGVRTWNKHLGACKPFFFPLWYWSNNIKCSRLSVLMSLWGWYLHQPNRAVVNTKCMQTT